MNFEQLEVRFTGFNNLKHVIYGVKSEHKICFTASISHTNRFMDNNNLNRGISDNWKASPIIF